MVKILGINGSPRGKASQTAILVRGVLRGAQDCGASVEYVDVCDLDLEFCTGCGTCYAKGECIHADDFCDIHSKMLESDGIVLGSPVYINSVTAQLKVLLDRLADSIHCQMFDGKYGCAVSTAGGSHADVVAEYLNSIIRILGGTTVGMVEAVLGPDPSRIRTAEKESENLGMALARAIAEKKVFPDQQAMHAEMRERMKALVTYRRDEWAHEYTYWKEKGWI